METTVPWPPNKSYGPWQLIFSTDQLSHSLFLSGYYSYYTITRKTEEVQLVLLNQTFPGGLFDGT